MLKNRLWTRAPVLILSAVLLAISACGQGGKGNKGNSQPPPSPFAGKTMAVKRSVAIVNRDLQTVEEALNNGVTIREMAHSIHDYSYDNLGRLTREVIRVFPQQPGSYLPEEGGVAFDMQFTYRTDVPWVEDITTMEQWDNWWDGASGARTSTTVWANDQEQVTIYDRTVNNIIERVELYETVDEVNEHGYVTKATRTQISGLDPNSTSETIYHRGADGKTLEAMESAGEEIEYEYFGNGALGYMEIVNFDSEGVPQRFETHDYLYFRQPNVFLIVIVAETYEAQTGSLIGTRTIFEAYEQAFCHEAIRRRDIFQRPNWEVCKELSEWN